MFMAFKGNVNLSSLNCCIIGFNSAQLGKD